jgi:hypothetical protein
MIGFFVPVVGWGEPLNLTSITTSITDPASTSYVVSLPGSTVAGDLLVVAICHRGNSAVSWPAGWTPLDQTSNSTTMSLSIGYRIANGSEGATIIVTGPSSKAAQLCFKARGRSGNPEKGTGATGTSANPDSPSVTPSWGVAQTLFIALWARADQAAIPATALPASYTLADAIGTSAALSCGIGAAYRLLSGSTDDPSAWTVSTSGAWVAQTIAVKPA